MYNVTVNGLWCSPRTLPLIGIDTITGHADTCRGALIRKGVRVHK